MDWLHIFVQRCTKWSKKNKIWRHTPAVHLQNPRNISGSTFILFITTDKGQVPVHWIIVISAFSFAIQLSANTQVRQNGVLFIAIAGCAPVTKKTTPQNCSKLHSKVMWCCVSPTSCPTSSGRTNSYGLVSVFLVQFVPHNHVHEASVRMKRDPHTAPSQRLLAQLRERIERNFLYCWQSRNKLISSC